MKTSQADLDFWVRKRAPRAILQPLKKYDASNARLVHQAIEARSFRPCQLDARGRDPWRDIYMQASNAVHLFRLARGNDLRDNPRTSIRKTLRRLTPDPMQPKRANVFKRWIRKLTILEARELAAALDSIPKDGRP